MICSILIGRKGSKGFPGKNTYPILGRPLMTYSLLAAKGSKHIDKIYVSTDSLEIKKIATKYNCEIINRPDRLCTSESKVEDVLIHAYNFIKQKLKKEIELLIVLMCNAPMITSKKIDEGIEILKKNIDYDSAVTVSCYNMFSPLRSRRIGKDGLLYPYILHEYCGSFDRMNSNRDSYEDVWFADMGVSIIRPKNVLDIEKGLLPQKWMGQKIYPLKQVGGFDIDYEWELPSIEYWLKKQGYTDI